MIKFMNADMQASVTKVCECLRMYHVACEAINEFGEETSAQKKFEVIDQFDKEVINEGVIPKLEKYVKDEILVGVHHDFKYLHNNSNVIYYIDGVPFCAYGAVTDEVAFLLQLEKSESYLVGNKLPDEFVKEALVVLSDFVDMNTEDFARKYSSPKEQEKKRPGVERLLTELQKRMVVSPLAGGACLDANSKELLIGTIKNSSEFLLDVMQYLGINEEYNVTYTDGKYTINDIHVIDKVNIDIIFVKRDYQLVAERLDVHMKCNNSNTNLSVESLIDEKTGEDEKRDKIFDLAYTSRLNDGLTQLSNGELYLSAKVKAIYLEDGKMVFFIEDPE